MLGVWHQRAEWEAQRCSVCTELYKQQTKQIWEQALSNPCRLAGAADTGSVGQRVGFKEMLKPAGAWFVPFGGMNCAKRFVPRGIKDSNGHCLWMDVGGAAVATTGAAVKQWLLILLFLMFSFLQRFWGQTGVCQCPALLLKIHPASIAKSSLGFNLEWFFVNSDTDFHQN